MPTVTNPSVLAGQPDPLLTQSRQGQYAGVASRGIAFIADLGALWGLYTLGAYAVALAWQLITGKSVSLFHHQVVATVVLVVWWFVYFSYQWAVGGRTIGMALFGLRVVQKNGLAVTARQAMVRAVFFYASFTFFVVGAIWILLQRQHRALHDLVAGTAVVYDWDARAARLRWLANRRAVVPSRPTASGHELAKATDRRSEPGVAT